MYEHKDGITVRKIRQADLAALLVLKQSSWWGTHTSPILNEDDQLRWYQNLATNCFVLVGEKDASVASISIISDVDWIARTAKISGSVLEEFRKKEVIEACCAAQIDFAFEMLNLHKLEAEVINYNLPAQHYEIGYLGFSLEGVKRESVYKCGHYFDSLILGLLRSEWENQPRIKSYNGSCNVGFDLTTAEKLVQRSYRFLVKRGEL